MKAHEDPRTLRQLNGYLKFNVRLAETRVEVEFLSGCITTNEYPVYHWRSLRRCNISPNSKTLKRHALSGIDSLRSKLTDYKNSADRFKATVDELLPDRRIMFEKYVNEIVTKKSNSKKDKLLLSIRKRTPEVKFPVDPEKLVFNYSSATLIQFQLETLALGPNFCLSKHRINRISVESQFEHLFGQLTELKTASITDVEVLKSQLVNTCKTFLNKKFIPNRLLSKAHILGVKDLLNNKNLLITRPDKGSEIVIMDRSEYVDKIESLLADTTKFQQLNNDVDKTVSIERNINFFA